jgi:hypothetical protein
VSLKILLGAFVGKMSIVATIETLDLSSVFVSVGVSVVVDSSISIEVRIILLSTAVFRIVTLLMTHEAFYLAEILLL